VLTADVKSVCELDCMCDCAGFSEEPGDSFSFLFV